VYTTLRTIKNIQLLIIVRTFYEHFSTINMCALTV